jgi:hypothetical protein
MTSITLTKLGKRAAVLGVALGGLTACVMDGAGAPPDTSYREARFEQMQQLKAFERCRDEGLHLDASARARGAADAFLTSADVLAKCNAEIGAAAAIAPEDERMRLHALSVVNYIRGGDVERARRQFDSFKAAWPDNDLYLTGGTSFIATAETLLGRTEQQTFGTFMALNVTDEMKREMRRMNHWKNR